MSNIIDQVLKEARIAQVDVNEYLFENLDKAKIDVKVLRKPSKQDSHAFVEITIKGKNKQGKEITYTASGSFFIVKKIQLDKIDVRKLLFNKQKVPVSMMFKLRREGLLEDLFEFLVGKKTELEKKVNVKPNKPEDMPKGPDIEKEWDKTHPSRGWRSS